MTARASITCLRTDGTAFTVRGRDGWALQQLIAAGLHGCSTFDHPAPRWPAYVHRLRHSYDLDVLTQYEPHGGAFPGRHARYVLREVIEIAATTARAAA